MGRIDLCGNFGLRQPGRTNGRGDGFLGQPRTRARGQPFIRNEILDRERLVCSREIPAFPRFLQESGVIVGFGPVLGFSHE